MTSTEKLGLLGLLAFVIWYFFKGQIKSAFASGVDGYIPPNDPRRLNTDPDLQRSPNVSPCSITKTAPAPPQSSRLTRTYGTAPQPSNITAQFPPEQFPWLYQNGGG